MTPQSKPRRVVSAATVPTTTRAVRGPSHTSTAPVLSVAVRARSFAVDDTTVEATGEERLAAALAPFGWTCTDAFWQRYYSDAWVFNLANAVERLSAAALPDPRPTEAEVMMGYGLTPYQRERLRALGCFRLKPTAEPSQIECLE